ncbi:MAG TPA: hypothetical protein VGO53_03995 [Steroidobacteraceae bacterium]|nr:hypothetical protein [Steroidobacteraceae bacterium]
MDTYIGRHDFSDFSNLADVAKLPDAGPMLTEAALADPVALASTHWESKWFADESAFDPSYERATDALRRWVDGMETALAKAATIATLRTRKTRRAR